MNLKDIEQDLNTHPLWPRFHTLVTSNPEAFDFQDNVTDFIFEMEVTSNDIDWDNLITNTQRAKFDGYTAQQIYFRAAIVPFILTLTELPFTATLDWMLHEHETANLGLATEMSLEIYDEDEFNTIDSIERLTSIRHLEHINFLEIFGQEALTDALVAALSNFFQRTSMTGLRTLFVEQNIGTDFIDSVFPHIRCPSLDTLHLRCAGLVPFSYTRPLTPILARVVNIHFIHCATQGVSDFLTLLSIENLEEFEIFIDNQEGETLEIFQAIAPLQIETLNKLTLDHTSKTRVNWAPFFERASILTLHSLFCYQTTFSVEHLAKLLKGAQNLIYLRINEGELADDAAVVLAKHIQPRLEWLYLQQNNITIKGARILATAEQMSTLNYFVMDGNLLSIESLQQLQELCANQPADNQPLAFGELRSLVHAEPTPEHWTTLCTRLDTWENTDYFQQVVLPYLNEQLQRWPDDVRVLPTTWITRLTQNIDVPAASIVRTLEEQYVDTSIVIQSHKSLSNLRHIHTFQTTPDDFQLLLNCPLAPNLKTLGCNFYDEMPTSANSSQLINILVDAAPALSLESLSLSGLEFDSDHVSKLAQHGLFTTIKDLTLIDCIVPNIAPLSHESSGSALNSIYFSRMSVPSDFDRYLAAPGTRTLKSLTFKYTYDNQVNILEHLANSPTIENLETLDIEEFGLEGEDVQCLLGASHLNTLRTLNLSYNSIGSVGLKYLSMSPCAQNIETLLLEYINIEEDDDVFAEIQHARWQPKNLHLSGNDINGPDLLALANSDWAKHLISLSLYDIPELDDFELVSRLLTSPNLKNLRTIDLVIDYDPNASYIELFEHPDLVDCARALLTELLEDCGDYEEE